MGDSEESVQLSVDSCCCVCHTENASRPFCEHCNLAIAQQRIAELQSLISANGDELKSARTAIFENAKLKQRIAELERNLAEAMALVLSHEGHVEEQKKRIQSLERL